MPIVQQGAINTTALVVPDLYVQIVPPQTLLLNGVPTDILGIVGSASWGPVGQPVVVGSMAQYSASFGRVMPRLYDMGTHVATSVQQGAQNFRCVRVTDGSDTAAVLTIQSAITLTALYTGSYGNGISTTISAGSQAGSTRITIALPGNTPEVFDNITGTGAALWQAMGRRHQHRLRSTPRRVPYRDRKLCRRHGGTRRRHAQLLHGNAGHGRRDQRHLRHARWQRLRAAHRHVRVARAGLLGCASR